jgi:prepilin-type processing-associated H-X9-DG protein
VKLHSRSGLALSELLVVLALCGAGVGLLLPAVLKLRAAAGRAACTDNLRKIGGGLHDYEAKRGKLPPRGVNAAEVGWATLLLPYIGEEKLYQTYHHDQPWRHPDNRAAVSTRVKAYACPVAAGDRESSGPWADGKEKWSAACTDYAANGGIVPLIIGSLYPPGTPRDGVFMPNVELRSGDITDGLSSTAAVFEVAGRPTRWNVGKASGEQVPGGAVKGPWAHHQNHIESRGHDPETGRFAPGTCAVNCSNFDGVYSFHPTGANALFCDGSVRHLSTRLDAMILHAVSTYAVGEVLAGSDF